MHSRQRWNAFVAAARESLYARGLPDDIVSIILGTTAHAVSVIVRGARAMTSDHRSVRLSVRWFRLNAGLPDPVFVRNHSWHWVDRFDRHMTYVEESAIHEKWISYGRPNPLRSVSICPCGTALAVLPSCALRVHFTELHALRRKTGRARRALPFRWTQQNPVDRV